MNNSTQNFFFRFGDINNITVDAVIEGTNSIIFLHNNQINKNTNTSVFTFPFGPRCSWEFPNIELNLIKH